MKFLELLRSNSEFEADLIIGGTDMPATFVWDEDSIITDYGIEKYKLLMEAECTVLKNGNIEIYCDNYKLGEDFCLAAAGNIGVTEYKKIFGE
jgi:hypothetical protein